MGGMAKPMGVALACVSAHAGSSGSNYGFVDNLINQEREQLVRNFQCFLDTPENCLAAVHAVCIYQILGLFGDNFLPAAIKPTTGMKDMLDKRRMDCERQAELHSSFVLKVYPLLCLKLSPLINFLDGPPSIQTLPRIHSNNPRRRTELGKMEIRRVHPPKHLLREYHQYPRSSSREIK
jgi:hypothetical protein